MTDRSVGWEVVQVESKWDVGNDETKADNKLDMWLGVRVKKVLQGDIEGIDSIKDWEIRKVHIAQKIKYTAWSVSENCIYYKQVDMSENKW